MLYIYEYASDISFMINIKKYLEFLTKGSSIRCALCVAYKTRERKNKPYISRVSESLQSMNSVYGRKKLYGPQIRHFRAKVQMETMFYHFRTHFIYLSLLYIYNI